MERNVAVKWVMLFIYGTGHFAPPLSLPPSPSSPSYTHKGWLEPNTTVSVYSTVQEWWIRCSNRRWKISWLALASMFTIVWITTIYTLIVDLCNASSSKLSIFPSSAPSHPPLVFLRVIASICVTYARSTHSRCMYMRIVNATRKGRSCQILSESLNDQLSLNQPCTGKRALMHATLKSWAKCCFKMRNNIKM